MGCMPDSGGCERHRTDPFVHHVNGLRGTSFRHVACLDREHRNSPQPEALYVDAAAGVKMVIERKSIIWPEDYAASHSNYHLVCDELSRLLGDLARTRPLAVHIGALGRRPRSDLIGLSEVLADSVRQSIDKIDAGRILRSDSSDPSWACYLDASDRADRGDPGTGLGVHWTSSEQTVDSRDLPGKLESLIRHAIDSAVDKFGGYHDCERILLLDPHGAIRYNGAEWWQDIRLVVPFPEAISEVWLAMHDWVSDSEQGWIFERVSPP